MANIRSGPEEHGIPSLAQSLRSYSERTGISQRKLARYLGMDPAVVNKVLLGKRDAPSTKKSRRFYENLPNLPDITQEELDAMLVAPDIPHWARKETTQNPYPPMIIEVGPVRVRMDFHADPSLISPIEMLVIGLNIAGNSLLILNDALKRKELL